MGCSRDDASTWDERCLGNIIKCARATLGVPKRSTFGSPIYPPGDVGEDEQVQGFTISYVSSAIRETRLGP